jgi:hypothetical protein
LRGSSDCRIRQQKTNSNRVTTVSFCRTLPIPSHPSPRLENCIHFLLGHELVRCLDRKISRQQTRIGIPFRIILHSVSPFVTKRTVALYSRALRSYSGARFCFSANHE